MDAERRINMKHKHYDCIVALKDRLIYDNGKLIWNKITGRHAYLKGTEAGYIDTYGYRQIKYKSKNIFAHQVVWLMFNDSIPEQIDHINRVRTDNRIENLRASNNHLNQHNTNIRVDNKSGYKGVQFRQDMNKWIARIGINGVRYNLGIFDSAIEASAAYEKKKKEYFDKLNDDLKITYQDGKAIKAEVAE